MYRGVVHLCLWVYLCSVPTPIGLVHVDPSQGQQCTQLILEVPTVVVWRPVTLDERALRLAGTNQGTAVAWGRLEITWRKDGQAGDSLALGDMTR